jgi:hypothetical protein
MSRENMNQPELGNGVEVSGGSPRPPEICSGDEIIDHRHTAIQAALRFRHASILHATSAANCY